MAKKTFPTKAKDKNKNGNKDAGKAKDKNLPPWLKKGKK